MTISTLPSIAVLGAGSMGGAIIRGVAASSHGATITATNRSEAKAAELKGLPGVTSIALEVTPDGNLDAVRGRRRPARRQACRDPRSAS